VVALPLIRPAQLPAGVGAAMSTRAGGVSEAPIDSLNLGAGVGDDPAAVAENRRRFVAALDDPAPRAVWLRQVHGIAVLRLGPGTPEHPDASADAAWTTERGIACLVGAADCLPVLLASDDGAVVGAAHAGWRGLAGGVVESLVLTMQQGAGVKPGQLHAWLGPCIGAQAFEVGAEVLQAFDVPAAAQSSAHFSYRPRPDGAARWRADLRALAGVRLRALGVQHIEASTACTVQEPSRFFSFRRDGRSGRMVAAIWRR
jgi:polyphenol oxidase